MSLHILFGPAPHLPWCGAIVSPVHDCMEGEIRTLTQGSQEQGANQRQPTPPPITTSRWRFANLLRQGNNADIDDDNDGITDIADRFPVNTTFVLPVVRRRPSVVPLPLACRAPRAAAIFLKGQDGRWAQLDSTDHLDTDRDLVGNNADGGWSYGRCITPKCEGEEGRDRREEITCIKSGSTTDTEHRDQMPCRRRGEETKD